MNLIKVLGIMCMSLLMSLFTFTLSNVLPMSNDKVIVCFGVVCFWSEPVTMVLFMICMYQWRGLFYNCMCSDTWTIVLWCITKYSVGEVKWIENWLRMSWEWVENELRMGWEWPENDRKRSLRLLRKKKSISHMGFHRIKYLGCFLALEWIWC